jgi:nucleotide-binding universal stress UspA family protein
MDKKNVRILCATDFTDHAERAATMAAAFARHRAATLILVHVVQLTGPGVLGPAKARLQEETARLRVLGTTVEPVLLKEFPPARALLKYIRTENPSLVIVSAGVKGFVDRWAFGSVSEEIAQSSPVPTMVLQSAEPFRRWDAENHPLRVLVAVDRASSSDVALRWVKELRKAGPCDLVTCYVKWQPVVGTTTELKDGVLKPGTAPSEHRQLEQDLRKKVRDLLGDEGGEVIIHPTWGSREASVLQIAREVRADLIVVGTHQRHGLSRLFHGSISRGLLHHPGINVVCVPTTAEMDPSEAHIPEYRRVLVATDLSALGNAAVPYGCAACAVGGVVRIIHIVPPTRTGAPRASAAKITALRDRLQGLVPEEVGARLQTSEVAVLEHRHPAKAICQEAERFGADLVCLASHGLSGSKAVFGSVSTAVLKHLRRPFLVVRRPEE